MCLLELYEDTVLCVPIVLYVKIKFIYWRNFNLINLHKVEFETSFGLTEQLRKSDLPEFVFSGRSNVGKSSMINKIFNRKGLARVSGVPGKTATINFFKVENVRFVDLPGYGYAKVGKQEKSRWAELISGYFAQDRDIALVFLLVDMRHTPSQEDMKMIEFLTEGEYPFVIVLTKVDKLSKTQRKQRLSALITEIPYGDEITMVPFSAETGEGVNDITDIVNEIIAPETEEDVDNIIDIVDEIIAPETEKNM